MGGKQAIAEEDDLLLQYLEIDETGRERIAHAWDEKAVRHLHFSDGFTLLAVLGDEPAGLISTYWRVLLPPLPPTREAYIDFLEVKPDHRRRGIARRLIDLSIQRARGEGVYQVRSWSSEDKVAAIQMWRRLGFALCPAVTYPGGQAVRGYFVSKVLNSYEPDDQR